MSYSAVQFIGYEIFTGPGQYPKRHFAGLDNDRDDRAARVALMEEALNAAKASRQVNNDRAVLKVFMAPEFYFRGQRGTYPIDLVTGTGPNERGLIGALTDMIKDPSWADWLVVFGTIVARSSGSRGRTEVYNISVVQQGSFRGESERLDKGVLIMKEFESSIDFLNISPEGLTRAEMAQLPAFGPGTYALEQNHPGQAGGGGYNGGSIFRIAGITFGLEMCLDHATRRLLRAWPRTDDSFIQVQLIPSAGMSIQAAAVATQSDGLVFNVDGLSSDQVGHGYGFHTDLRFVRQRLPTDGDLIAVPSEARVPVNRDLNALTRVFWLPPDNNLANPAARAPQLAFYPLVPLPQSRQAG